MKKLFLAIILIVTGSCARAPLTLPSEALRPVKKEPVLLDDLSLESFQEALIIQLEDMNKGPDGPPFVFHDKIIPYRDYANALQKLLDFSLETESKESVNNYIRENFSFYEVYGQKKWGEVQITSYFEPVIHGSKVPTEKYSQALYRKPDDLIAIDLERWDSKYSEERKLRGRVINKSIVPYYTREEIDQGKALTAKGLEICWVDPIDAFFLHIQGSGIVSLEDGKEIKLNYAEKNGQPYKALGNFLKHAIPLSQMSMQNIEKYLRTLDKSEIQKYFNKNPSYVFFTVSDQNAVTYSGVPATAGRTIATDKKFFPKKALAFLEFKKPVSRIENNFEYFSEEKVSRYVFDQDIGGAIQGGGRVDLFWGRGDDAKKYAGRVNTIGKLLYLVPK